MAWEAADAADAARAQAEERARTAEERVGELERQLTDASAALAAAGSRAEAAEQQAAQTAVARDTALHELDVATSETKRTAAELTAGRRQAERETTTIQAACQAREEAARELATAATARAERAETALEAERTERRALTATLAQARPRNRPTASPKNDNQPREAELRPA